MYTLWDALHAFDQNLGDSIFAIHIDDADDLKQTGKSLYGR